MTILLVNSRPLNAKHSVALNHKMQIGKFMWLSESTDVMVCYIFGRNMLFWQSSCDGRRIFMRVNMPQAARLLGHSISLMHICTLLNSGSIVWTIHSLVTLYFHFTHFPGCSSFFVVLFPVVSQNNMNFNFRRRPLVYLPLINLSQAVMRTYNAPIWSHLKYFLLKMFIIYLLNSEVSWAFEVWQTNL